MLAEAARRAARDALKPRPAPGWKPATGDDIESWLEEFDV